MDKILEIINSVPKQAYYVVEIIAAMFILKWWFGRTYNLSNNED